MKNILPFVLVLILFLSLTTKKKGCYNKKLKILTIDSTDEFYVFNTKNGNNEFIIIAEKEKVNKCQPFKKFILKDSVSQTSMIKSGDRFDYIGHKGFTINGVKIKKEGELARIINSCGAFND